MLSHLRRLEDLLFDPPATPLGRPATIGLTILRYLYALARDLATGEINMRAMSLVYTTLLSIVPLTAFCFAIVKGLGFHRDFEPLIYEFFRPLGDRASELTARVIGFVDHMQGGVLGSLGLAFLLWTTVSVIQKVEASFNHIWHVEQPRSLARRFSEYLSVLVVAPVLMVSGLGLMASLETRSLVEWLKDHPPLGLLLVMAGEAGPLLIVTLGFTFLYSFIPNTRVRFGVAFSAGLAAAAVWVTASFAFTRLVGVSTHMLAIYASFAILLAALMWVWLNWLILLTGALLAFYLQNPEYLRAGQREVMPTPRLREGLALSSMYLVARAFSEGRERPTLESLAETLTVPATALAPVLHALETSGLLEHTEEEGLLPGRDPTRITLDEVVSAVRGGHSGRAMTLHRAALVNPAQQACDRIEAAIRRELGTATLAEFAQTDDVPR